MSKEFDIIQLDLGNSVLKNCGNQLRDQLVGCMHAHNELATFNRIFIFSMNSTGEGELHDSAHSVQTWSILQVLAGKLCECWKMIYDRFIKQNPLDITLDQLDPGQKESLHYLQRYFDPKNKGSNPLLIFRDKTAFHYEKLNLEQSLPHLADGESTIYLAQHPANSLYYVGTSLVFRAVFAMIYNAVKGTNSLTHAEKMKHGFTLTVEHTSIVNLHMHQLLYGLIRQMLSKAVGKPIESLAQIRIKILDAPDPDQVGLPAFIDIGQA